MTNSIDPDQTGGVWSGSALFAQAHLSENLGSLWYLIHHPFLTSLSQPFSSNHFPKRTSNWLLSHGHFIHNFYSFTTCTRISTLSPVCPMVQIRHVNPCSKCHTPYLFTACRPRLSPSVLFNLWACDVTLPLSFTATKQWVFLSMLNPFFGNT